MIALFFQSKPTVGGGNGPNPTSLSSNAIHLNSKIATVAISYYSLKSSAKNKNPLWTNKFHSVFEMKWVTLNRSILAISVLARVPDFRLYGGHTNTKNMTQKYFFISLIWESVNTIRFEIGDVHLHYLEDIKNCYQNFFGEKQGISNDKELHLQNHYDFMEEANYKKYGCLFHWGCMCITT